MVKGFWRMHTDPPGFDPNGIVCSRQIPVGGLFTGLGGGAGTTPRPCWLARLEIDSGHA
jgi:hypothetical protein